MLDFGAILASGTPTEVQADQAVLDAYLGAEPVTTEAARADPSTARPGVSEIDATPPVLELRGVRAAYGRIEVLHGVDLVVPAGRGGRAARPERRRQVDHAQGGQRADAARPPGACTSPAAT